MSAKIKEELRLAEMMNEDSAAQACFITKQPESFVQDTRATKIVSAHADPYIVVLIDGSSLQHHFKDEHIRMNGKGGLIVAQLLSTAIARYMHPLPEIPHSSRVLVRIYADLKTLSTAAIRSKLVDPKSQCRALAPFVVAFNRVDPWFEMLDAGDQYNIKTKVSANFEVYEKDPNCRHIIFGVGFMTTYEELLEGYGGPKEKLVLLRLGQVAPVHERLGFKMTEFPTVFCSGTGSANKSGGASGCSRGSGGGPGKLNPHGLPTSGPSGLIPVNAAGERIDLYFKIPYYNNQNAFNARRPKPCAKHHLLENCQGPCNFDHSALNPTEMRCLRFKLKGKTCQLGSQCRDLDCIYAHVCQKISCFGGKTIDCWFPDDFHKDDSKVAEWVDPDEFCGPTNGSPGGPPSDKPQEVIESHTTQPLGLPQPAGWPAPSGHYDESWPAPGAAKHRVGMLIDLSED